MAGVVPNLIMNVTVNPPQISIIGPVKETTVQKLNTILPNCCTSASGQRTRMEFVRKDVPPHWYAELPTAFANEEMGQSQIFLSLMDALEEEGQWILKGTNATNHDDTKVTYKFFFMKDEDDD